YDYQVSLANYHTYTGFVVVDDPENTHKVEVNLLPNFGWIEVSGDGLEDASVYIDNALAGKVPFKSKALKSGQHNIRIVKKMYNDYSDVVTVKDNETTRLSPSLKADFAGITLKVDADAEIWVNNERKCVRTWTGPLSSGTYKIECKQANHETTMITKEITPQMAGQTIKLEPPHPIYGSLDVVSTPNFATLYIDGKKIGETPRFIKDLLIGSHELRLAKEGCAPIQKTIVIKKGETLEVKETLATGKSVTVKTDRAGDKVYVDNNFVGETPITTSVGFGQHTIKVTRNNVPVEKTITIAEHDSDRELLFEFGRMITIKTDQDGDAVFVDGNKVGVSPISIDLPFGNHIIRAERNKKYDEMEINTQAFGSKREYMLTLHSETVSHFVENGVNFATIDLAYSPAPQTSFGATFGSVKKVGWFISAASNFKIDALHFNEVANAYGFVGGDYYYDYTGESCSTRLSVMGGLVAKIGGPVFVKAGAGYGSRVKSWYTTNGSLVKISDDSFSGIDATAGILFNLKGFSFSIDAVTTNFKTIEAKVGLGYCWKRK
ncbi:MAG: PEGA domain-containing protein, partial [Bacteroidales bacterium]|nr:PEGA domain-containing protein [Bacteroidales bacterium]